MAFHTEWDDNKERAPIYIKIGNGAEEILTNKYLLTALKEPGLSTLGVLLDADQNPAQNRYGRIRSQVEIYFPNLPDQLPKTGLIAENDNHLRFGVWIMPDNQSRGDLELFLKELVPDENETIWQYAVEAVGTAQTKGCPCKENHCSKANLYTWLAWQNPPGQSPGRALTQKILDPKLEKAAHFVKWFMDLYALPPLEQGKLILT